MIINNISIHFISLALSDFLEPLTKRISNLRTWNDSMLSKSVFKKNDKNLPFKRKGTHAFPIVHRE